jgi:hypothetical protein
MFSFLRAIPLVIVVGGALRAQAVAEVTPATLDIGRVTTKNAVNLSFRITNRGNEPLLVSDISLSCGCTTFGNTIRSFWLEPGTGRDVPLVYNTRGIYGPFKKTVAFTTNDKAHKVVTGVFTGIGARPIEYSSNLITLGGKNRKDLLTATVEIRYNDPEQIPEDTRLESDNSWLTARWSKLDRQAGVGTILVIVDPKDFSPEASQMKGTVVFQTGVPAQPAVPVQVIWNAAAQCRTDRAALSVAR